MQETQIKPGYIHHVFFKAKRFELMKAFYKLVFHCEPLFENEMFSWLSFDQEHHRFALQNSPAADDQKLTDEGLDHVGYQYKGPDELFATYERLAAARVMPFWCTNHGGTTSFYYRDPDGNGLELQYDNFDSMEEVLQWLHEGDFAQNPVGVDVDPAKLIAAYRGGLGRTELHERSRRGEYLPDGMTMQSPAKPFPGDLEAYLDSIRDAVGQPPE